MALPKGVDDRRHFLGVSLVGLHQFAGLDSARVIMERQSAIVLDHAGCPVLCDRLYGGRAVITRGEIRREPDDSTVLLERQALHAARLRFVHPTSGEPMTVEAPLPADMEAVLAELRQWRRL